MKCLNDEKREELVCQSLYFGRKSNELVCCGLLEDRGCPEVRKVSKPTKCEFNIFKKLR